MKNIVKCAALGLSVAASSLAIAKPASANPWYMASLKAELEGNSMCWGVSGGADSQNHIKAGTHIIMWTCNNKIDQVWTAVAVPGYSNVDVFQNGATDSQGNAMCLTDASYTSDRGQPLTVYPCTNGGTGGPGQRFYVSGGLTFINTYSARVIGIANGQNNTITNGMAVIMWDSNGSYDQDWAPFSAP